MPSSQNQTFQVRLDWEAYDSEGAKAALEAAGINVRYADMTEEEKQTANAIYKGMKISGMNRFPAHPTAKGVRLPVWKSQAGNTVEAKSTITKFYPSNETVKM